MSSSIPLDVAVRDLLEGRRGQWKSIAVESKVSYSWIEKFMRRKIANPGFATLTALHAYLANGLQDGAPPAPTEEARDAA